MLSDEVCYTWSETYVTYLTYHNHSHSLHRNQERKNAILVQVCYHVTCEINFLNADVFMLSMIFCGPVGTSKKQKKFKVKFPKN